MCLPAVEVWGSLLEGDAAALPSTGTSGTATAAQLPLERTQSEGETAGEAGHPWLMDTVKQATVLTGIFVVGWVL